MSCISVPCTHNKAYQSHASPSYGCYAPFISNLVPDWQYHCHCSIAFLVDMAKALSCFFKIMEFGGPLSANYSKSVIGSLCYSYSIFVLIVLQYTFLCLICTVVHIFVVWD